MIPPRFHPVHAGPHPSAPSTPSTWSTLSTSAHHLRYTHRLTLVHLLATILAMLDADPLIPQHGGFRRLKSFQIAQLVYDLTVRFCDRYIDRRSRTRDQMVQAARSGVQNIAEGSQASGTSKKTELKLTGVARASLEELRLDYEDFSPAPVAPVGTQRRRGGRT